MLLTTRCVCQQSAAARPAAGPVSAEEELIIGSDVSPASSLCMVTKPAPAGAAPCHEHADSRGSYGRPTPHPVCTDYGSSMVDLCPILHTLTVVAQTTLQVLWAVTEQLNCVLSQGLCAETQVSAPGHCRN